MEVDMRISVCSSFVVGFYLAAALIEGQMKLNKGGVTSISDLQSEEVKTTMAKHHQAREQIKSSPEKLDNFHELEEELELANCLSFRESSLSSSRVKPESLALNIEEGTPGQVSRERRDGTNSFSGSFQRGPYSGFEIQWNSRIRELLKCNDGKLAKFFLGFKEFPLRRGLLGECLFLFLCFEASVLGSDYLYMLVVNDDKKCLELNKDVRTMDIVSQIGWDLGYILIAIFQLRIDSHQKARKRSWLILLVDVLVVLPVGQVLLILSINQKMTRMDLTFVFDLFLVQYALRVLRLCPLFRYRSGAIADDWSNFSGIEIFIGAIFALCYMGAAGTKGRI
ncbi:hypothetical protein Patl1_20954 [Pistacia atlantica]|uniref:Uncharacterized protein n=1 Tax=Pistacia atlantica TaxID=434234 RepID=A0ACC1BL81_9ROSI|nr:hypothetical protein Patl1_20954 [Pistacia atlantica]